MKPDTKWIEWILRLLITLAFLLVLWDAVKAYVAAYNDYLDIPVQLEREKLEHHWKVRKAAIEIIIEADEEILNELAKEKNNPLPDPTKCLTDNIYFESGFQSYEGKLAVAQVTLNRAHTPANICSVVYHKSVNPNTGKKEAAFSWTLGKKWKPKGIDRHAYKECAQIAKAVLTKHLHSAIIGPEIKYYHRTDMTASWDGTHTLVAQIGDHSFYR